MKHHLAIFAQDAAKQVLKGAKTIETRFSQKRIPPYGEVNVGDIVYIKPAGEEICGQFLVAKVIYFENIGSEDIKFIRDYYGQCVSLGSKEKDNYYFLSKKSARYGTIIFIDRVEQFIVSPIKIQKKRSKRLGSIGRIKL